MNQQSRYVGSNNFNGQGFWLRSVVAAFIWVSKMAIGEDQHEGEYLGHQIFDVKCIYSCRKGGVQ